jgi:flagellum-specific peptidoglycan hydrolase FlgJ
LAQYNNYFGIKAMKPLSAYSSDVHALLAPPYRIRRRDKAEGSNDYYFVFKSPEACLEYRKKNLERQRYQRQIDRIPNPQYFAQWAQAIAEGGWATDKDYADKLIGMIERLELYLLD